MDKIDILLRKAKKMKAEINILSNNKIDVNAIFEELKHFVTEEKRPEFLEELKKLEDNNIDINKIFDMVWSDK